LRQNQQKQILNLVELCKNILHRYLTFFKLHKKKLETDKIINKISHLPDELQTKSGSNRSTNPKGPSKNIVV
jgi:hypothetical protein